MTQRHGIAVYPGSFDPLTRGHLDVIQRTSRVFSSVIVAVAHNPAKKHTFSVSERLRMVEDAIRHIPNAEADTYSGLLVDFLKTRHAKILIRGLRVVSDMDYEFQLASMNRRLSGSIETVFLMPDEKYAYLSSSMVREVARLGAPVVDFVTPFVARQLARKFKA
ncbi:MAG: pantetheine-phosphate adenylyltransferase [Elusimicrobiota bacterium]|jgi:pantetheine-phosphate adenylyltransferase